MPSVNYYVGCCNVSIFLGRMSIWYQILVSKLEERYFFMGSVKFPSLYEGWFFSR